MNILSHSGTRTTGKNDEYALTNKESNFLLAVRRESTDERNQPTNAKYVKTQKRLRRSLTPEDKAKLMALVFTVRVKSMQRSGTEAIRTQNFMSL